METTFRYSATETKPKMSFQDARALLTHAVETEKKDREMARARKLAAEASAPVPPEAVAAAKTAVAEQD